MKLLVALLFLTLFAVAYSQFIDWNRGIYGRSLVGWNGYGYPGYGGYYGNYGTLGGIYGRTSYAYPSWAGNYGLYGYYK